jgi:hypothetical protein
MAALRLGGGGDQSLQGVELAAGGSCARCGLAARGLGQELRQLLRQIGGTQVQRLYSGTSVSLLGLSTHILTHGSPPYARPNAGNSTFVTIRQTPLAAMPPDLTPTPAMQDPVFPDVRCQALVNLNRLI